MPLESQVTPEEFNMTPVQQQYERGMRAPISRSLLTYSPFQRPRRH